MSLLTDFAARAFTTARRVIGGERLHITGGPILSVVLNHSGESRDFTDAEAFEPGSTLDAVCPLAEFVAAYPDNVRTYLGKIATTRGRTFRIQSIDVGQAFVTLHLFNPAKA